MIAGAPTNPAYEIYLRSFSDVFDFATAPRAKYIAPEHHDGNTCPFCGSDQLDPFASDEYQDDGSITSPYICLVCQGEWREVYYLGRYQVTDFHGNVLAEFPHTVEFRRHRAYCALLEAAKEAEVVLAEVLRGAHGAPARWHDARDTLRLALAYGENYGDDLPL